MEPTTFSPVSSLIGGMLIGLAAVLLMATTGRVAGVSGIVARLLPPYRDGEGLSRLAFVAGLLLAPMLYTAAGGAPVAHTVSSNLPLLAVAGLLVGAGAVVGGGCTSGHGVCGIARLPSRSIASTAVFMATAFATVFLMRHVVGA
jgi:uncharacterized membrane protein YedE/YeeE